MNSIIDSIQQGMIRSNVADIKRLRKEHEQNCNEINRLKHRNSQIHREPKQLDHQQDVMTEAALNECQDRILHDVESADIVCRVMGVGQAFGDQDSERFQQS